MIQIQFVEYYQVDESIKISDSSVKKTLASNRIKGFLFDLHDCIKLCA